MSALQDALPDGIVPNSVTMRPGAAAVEPYALYAIEYCCPSDICALQDEYEAAPMVYEKRSKKGVSSMKDLKSLAPFVQFGSSEGKTQVRALLSAKADSYASPLAFASLLSSSLPSLSGGGQPSVRKLAAGERMAFCGGASFFEA